jgi:ribonuclease HI/probable phosphoglycerate mutase
VTSGSIEGVLYIDGASFGNPGPSGIGIVLVQDDDTVVTRSEDIGYGTNNRAEYTALLEGLRTARDRGIRDLTVRSDSQLLVRQMTGEYKVKHKGLVPLRIEAESLTRDFDRVRFEHIPREENEEADALSKMGAEEAKLRGVTGPRAADELF